MPLDQKIIARCVIQMIGSPKEHIVKTLGLYIDKIEADYKHIKVLDDYRGDPEKNESGLYNVFSELELEIQGIENLVWFCFDYMPASVEIVEPAEFIYEANHLTDFLNDLLAKLHRVDMSIKNLSAENQVVKNNGVTLMRNIIKLSLKGGPAGVETIAKNAGVPKDHIIKFLETMEKEGKIKKDQDKYSLL